MHIIMRILLRTCKKSTELIDKQMLSSLTLKEKIQLQAHKAICQTCNTYEHQSKLIDGLIGQWFAPNQSNGSMKMVEARKLTIIEKLKKA
jgi:hypothetical protein